MPTPAHRIRRRLVAIATILLAWVVALAAVRIGLDWSDAQEYAPWVETYYVVLASAAVLIAAVGTVVGVVLWRRGR